MRYHAGVVASGPQLSNRIDVMISTSADKFLAKRKYTEALKHYHILDGLLQLESSCEGVCAIMVRVFTSRTLIHFIPQ